MRSKKPLTKEQIAVIETAKAFLLRGYRIQYEDSRFTSWDFQAGEFTWYEYRAEYRGINGEAKKNPEDYTSTDLGYTNCADFTHDVYHSALDFDFFLSFTYDLTQEAKRPDTKLGVYYYEITGNETEEEKARIEKEYREMLEPGDLVVVRYTTNGHVMLYVGNDEDLSPNMELIHSTGNSYNYNEKKEKFEENGSIGERNLDFYFRKGLSKRYLFDTYNEISIIRPLNVFKGKIPKETKNRIKHLKGVIAEKISSHPFGKTISRGENLTYTFNVINTTDLEKNIEIKDVVPSNCSFVSASKEFSRKDNRLLAKFKLLPNQTRSISFTVTVNSGDYVYATDAFVNGVPTNCRKIYVRNTLNSTHQKQIVSKIKSFTKSNPNNLKDVDIINDVYNTTLGKPTKLTGSFPEIVEKLHSVIFLRSYTLDKKGDYFSIIVPGIYGGRLVATSEKFDRSRTRLVTPAQLIVGDVIIVKESFKKDTCYSYLYGGDALYKIDGTTVTETSLDVLETLISYDFFTVLRPSMDL